MSSHDPVRFVADLGAKLATRSRHVCALLGAGAACACGLPGVVELQERVLERLEGEQRDRIGEALDGRNLEQALSRLRRIVALLEDEQEVDGLTATAAAALDAAACRAIVGALALENADLDPMLVFAAWVARTDYRLPLEIFTVNYDLLLETALEQLRVAYFDGFVGTLNARFHTELVENAPVDSEESVPAFFTRLWKLHGSVNWAWRDGRYIVRLGQAVSDGQAAAIYPSDTKYEESRRVPFVVLQDRFRRALLQPETLVLIAGYSFGDEHLNELIFDGAIRRERSEFVAFCYSQIPEVLVQRALVTPNIQVVAAREAIIGGVRGSWSEPEDPPVDVWHEGAFALGDFRRLARHLARSSTRVADRDALVGEIFDRLASEESTGGG